MLKLYHKVFKSDCKDLKMTFNSCVLGLMSVLLLTSKCLCLQDQRIVDIVQSLRYHNFQGSVHPIGTHDYERYRLVQNGACNRVLFPLVNEGFKCLEEGIVQRPSDIDVVYVYGYGWPVWRGGPMYWADNEIGLPRLLEGLKRLSRQFPETEHYRPSALLERCVGLTITVEDYYQQQARSKL